MSTSGLGYIAINVQEIDEWKTFGSDILGLMLNSDTSTEETLYFRMDDHPHRLVLNKSDEDKLAAVGWEYANEAAFEAVIEALEAAGQSVTRGDESGAKQRQVTDYAVSSDPAGNPIEVFYGRTGLSDDFASPLDIEAFITGDLGMGHVVLPAPNMDETHGFYKEVMGFGDSDNLTLPPPAEGAPEMNVRFMHAQNPRHHSLALFNYPVPNGLVHLILEVGKVDEVGACLDRVNKAGYPLMSTLGRHCNDNMLSFYVVGPGGMAIEFGCDGLHIDWQNYTATVSTQGDIWGHEYVPPVA